MNTLFNWALDNWIEVCGMLSGFIYLWFSVRQSIFTWPFGLLTSMIYAFVFYKARFYAGMGLQFYYFFISIYGWLLWVKGSSLYDNEKKLHISRTSKRMWIGIICTVLVLFIMLASILKNYTDSPIPFWDAFTTSLSIVASWMLARKKFEHWFLWMLVDTVSIILYISQELYPTTLLFIAYSVMAVVGYFEWRKDLKKIECQTGIV